MENIKKMTIPAWNLESGKTLKDTPLFYQAFGPALGQAPIVLVNHALTGNSNVTGENGWWKTLIGKGKAIDTRFFTIIAFNIPGNGFDGNYENLIFNYREFTARDIAALFWMGLDQLQAGNVFAVIGGSLGGGIAWEMAVLEPQRIRNLIPVAADWRATDWIIANVLVQDRILNNSDDPVADARVHAMLLYRTPESLQLRFRRQQLKDAKMFGVESWLQRHGLKLQDRFRLASYKLMNHLLKTIDITKGYDGFPDAVRNIDASIHLIAIDTDLFFVPGQNRETFKALNELGFDAYCHEIRSVHGHDAFLMEYRQLTAILKPIFNNQKQIHHAAS